MTDPAPRPTADLPTVPAGQVVAPPAPRGGSLPTVIGGWRRLRLLGAGGMGEVHLAEGADGQRCALKLLRAPAQDAEEFRQRFLREAGAMRAVSHANVVGVRAVGEDQGLLFMAIDYVEGGDLARLLKARGTLDEATVIALAIGCCHGLEALQAAGLVHRDIKPANIFLGRDLMPRLGDLGLARHADGADRFTMTGHAWGTPAYMPPEQLRGQGDLDHRVDLYALGATLYTALTGGEPFLGETQFVVTERILNERAPDVRGRNRTVSAGLAAIIATCLEKDRTRRFGAPAELRADLERLRDGQPLLHTGQMVADQPAAVGLGDGAGRASALAMLTVDPVLAKVIAGVVLAAVLVVVAWSVKGGTSVERTTTTTVVGALSSSRAWMSDNGEDTAGAWAQLRIGTATARLRLLPAGTFIMGSPASELGRGASEVQHQIHLTQAVWMAETETTRGMYAAALGQDPPDAAEAALPVTGLSQGQAEEYCAALGALLHGPEVRLPTEAEWEYACRAGSATAFATGAGPDPREVLGRIAAAARPVPAGAANRFGLYDLHGNVREWCQDRWDGTTPFGDEADSDPLGIVGNLVVVRGGSAVQPITAGRSAARHGLHPDESGADLGFRLVLTDD